MSKKLKQTMIATMLSVVMFMLAVPQVLWVKAAEAIKDIEPITIRRKVDNLPSINANIDFESLTILAEDPARRTANSKEYILNNGMRMVKQYAKNVHCLDNGVYKEVDETESLTTTNSAQLEPIETGFKQINVFESGKVTTDKELLIGKKDGEEKSDAYLQFEMAKKGMGYKLLYSKLEFSHQTKGMSLLAPKSIKYSVSLVENNVNVDEISYTNKPKQIGEEQTYGSSINAGETSATNKYEIDVSAIQDNTVTFAIETEQANSAGAYSVMDTNQIVLISIYNRTYGLDENYGSEKVEIDGVQAYVDYDKNNLTVNTELFTVNSTGNTPISLSLVNNQGYEDIFDELITAGITNVKVFGNNTKLNFQQYTRKITDLALPIIVHYDADGSITQYYSTGNNYYHSYMGTMTLKEEGTTHYIYDASGNTSKFVNGRLTEIYTNDGQTTNLKDNSEKIIISYDSLNRMSGISYYEGNNYNDAAYQITFEYLAAMGNYVHGITAKKRTPNANGTLQYVPLLIYYVFYDSYGNISSIYNSYENIDAYNFEYDNTSENNIKFVNNRRLEGLNFEYDNSNVVNSIKLVQGDCENAYNYTDVVTFQRLNSESRTILYSLSGGTSTATKGITLDGSRRVISEWLEDSDGNATVYAPGVWENGNGQEYTFNHLAFSSNLINGQLKREVVHEIEKNTTLMGSYSLNAGESITAYLINPPKIESDTCVYAISFKVDNASGATIEVNASGGNHRSITLPNCYETYVTMLCDFMGSSSDYIVIESDKNVTISNVGYGIAEFTEEERVLDSTTQILYTNNVTTKSSDGEQINYTYDNKQEMTQQVVTNAQGLVETTLTFDAQKEDGNIVPTTEIRRNGDLVFSTENSVDESGVITQTTRDGNGNCVKEKVVNSEINDGNKKVTIIENGVSTIYYYGISGGDERLIRVESIDRLDAYTYNYFGEVLTHQIINKTNNEVEQVILSQQNTYTDGVLTNISYGNPNSAQTHNFNLTYDSIGRLSQIKHDGTAKVTYNYATANNGGVNRLTGKTFANGNTVEYTYGTDGITNTTYKNSAGTVTDQYPITKDSSGDSSVSHVKGSSTNLTYTYSENFGQNTFSISGLTNNLSYTTGYFSIFGENLTANSTITVSSGTSSATSHAISQTYNQLGQLTQYGYSNFNSAYGYDLLGKLTTYTKTYGTSVIESKSYEYEQVSGELYDSNRVSRIVDNQNVNKTQTLVYDAKGNIQSVTTNEKTFNYVYDNANRVTKDIYSGNGSYTRNEYYYDNNYNAITERKIYYSENATAYVPILFEYNTLGQLTFMNEYNEPYYFAYDEMGNPTKFKVSSPDAPDNFVWSQGRYLTSGTLFNTTFSYEYDASGIRYKKTVNNKVTEYYLNGTQILAENRIGHGGMIYYFYDATGVAGMIYGGNYYFYEKNAFGDVIRVVDSNGNEVASYEYNAWGELVALSGSMAFINPFRYRGYYCDEETGFYYLQSRYYCPNIMRFINADDYEIVGALMNDPGQLYMYNYCNNNPVMYTDESGQFILISLLIWGAVIGGTISGGIAVAEQVAKYGWDLGAWNWLEIGVAALGGALSGMIAATPIGVLGQMAINAGISMLQNTAIQLNRNEGFNFTELIASGVIGAISGLGGGNGVLHVGKTMADIMKNYIAVKTLKTLSFKLIYGITKATAVGYTGGKTFNALARGV